jgi:hypothetical protein
MYDVQYRYSTVRTVAVPGTVPRVVRSQEEHTHTVRGTWPDDGRTTSELSRRGP